MKETVTMNISDLRVPAFDLSSGVLVYGAGKTGRFVVEQCRLAGIPVRAILDRSTAKGFADVDVFQFPHVPKAFCCLPLILALHGGVWEARESLYAAGFRNVYTMSQFYLYMEHVCKKKIPCYVCLGEAGKISEARHDIEAVYDMLADERSKEIFSAQLEYRLTGDFDFLLRPDPGPVYYSDNRPFVFPESVSFVDCGAFDGDTLRELMPLIDFKSIMAFEPDPETFEKLRNYLGQQEFSGDILTFQAGVGERNDILAFCCAQDGGTFSEVGEIMVPVMSLDALFRRYNVDFIKMDIEGGETGALFGATALIRHDQPLLAISVYHKPEDLWQLPALIKRINPEYSLYLRVHRGSYHDTVCYAVPKKFGRT